jgi:Glutathione S-transferase, N-terminal domain
MTLSIHGVSSFTCTRRVALIAKERNVPYELVPVNFATGEHKQPAYIEHQPFGQVPYIVVRLSPITKAPQMFMASDGSPTSSKRTDSSCLNHALSAATLQRRDPAQS